MGRESAVNEFAKSDLLTQCLIVQWFDYSVLYIDPAVNHKSLTELVLQVCLGMCTHTFNSTLASVYLFLYLICSIRS